MVTRKPNERATPAGGRSKAKKAAPPKKRGYKPWEPTTEEREKVAALAGYGLPEPQIALLTLNPKTGKPISNNTLRAHFAKDLESGRAKAGAQTFQTAFNMANGVREVRQINADKTVTVLREEQKPDKTMNIWLQKTQFGVMEEEVRVRTRIAERIAEMRGIVDDSADPQDIAKRIKAELDKLEESVTGAPRSAPK